ncbi:MAG: LPS-assembly protein LptD [Spirochaetota bacterium]
MIRFLIALILFYPSFSLHLWGQAVDQQKALADFYLQQGIATPTQKSPAAEAAIRELSETQKKILRNAMDKLSDREVDRYLRELGHNTSGSIYAKRKRLRNILGVDTSKKVKDEIKLPKNTQENKQENFIIENATEGEFIKVDKTHSGILILRGRVRIRLGSGVLEADSITVDSDRKEIYAEGGIKYEDGPIKASGEKFIYDLNLQRGILYKVKADAKTAFFLGEKIKKIDETKYMLEMGHFTACNAEVPHYTFQAKRIIVNTNRSVIATNLWFRVGSMDLFWVPLFYTTNLGSGWVVQAGRNQSQGTFLQANYQWSDPLATLSLLSPIGRRVKLDYYEKTGQAVGLEFWKQSPWLNYRLDLGYANYKRNEVTTAFATRFRNGGVGNVVVTNQVDKGDLCIRQGRRCLISVQEWLNLNNPGSAPNPIREYGEENEAWTKINLLANIKKNNAFKDGTRNVQIKLENYSNPAYEYEFGYRYQPSNTLQAIYTQRNQRQPFFKQNTEWKFDYTESRGDLSINLLTQRLNNYNILAPRDRSDFFPIFDEIPRFSLKNSSEITRLPYFHSPVYWDINVLTSVRRYYGAPVKEQLKFPLPPDFTNFEDPWGRYKASLLRTEYFTNGETGFKTTMYYGSYISFSPGLYYGAFKRSAERPDSSAELTQGDIALDRSLKRDSYQYLRNNHIFRAGVPALLFTADYRRIQSTKAELPDETLQQTSDQFSPPGSQDRVHETEFTLSSNSLEYLEVSLSTIRDLRQFASDYEPHPTNAERWYFTIFRVGGYYDFLDGFKSSRATLLEKRRSFFSGVFYNNDFVYHTPQKDPLYNNLTLGYQMGGFRLPLIRKINRLEIGSTWYHFYKGNYMDSYRVYFQTDFQFTRFTGLEIEVDSRVTQPWRYSDYIGNQSYFRNGLDSASIANAYANSTNPIYQPTNIGQDVIDGTGLAGQEARQNTAFNLHRFQITYKHNLHNFDFKLGYSMDLRSIAGGASLDSQITFYDQAVFAMVSLTNIGFGQQSSLQESRVRLYRFRKRPLDGSSLRSSISSE